MTRNNETKMTKGQMINLILEVAEELGIDVSGCQDDLMEHGFRYAAEGWTEEEIREVLLVNLV